MKVPEYFQFDPTEDYLKPALQGRRLEAGEYVPIAPIEGRLPSEVIGLHLEREGPQLRLYDPVTGRRLLKRMEQRIHDAMALREAETRANQAEAEIERLRRELEAVRRQGKSNGT